MQTWGKEAQNIQIFAGGQIIEAELETKSEFGFYNLLHNLHNFLKINVATKIYKNLLEFLFSLHRANQKRDYVTQVTQMKEAKMIQAYMEICILRWVLLHGKVIL